MQPVYTTRLEVTFSRSLNSPPRRIILLHSGRSLNHSKVPKPASSRTAFQIFRIIFPLVSTAATGMFSFAGSREKILSEGVEDHSPARFAYHSLLNK